MLYRGSLIGHAAKHAAVVECGNKPSAAHLVGVGALEGGAIGVEVLELEHAHLAQGGDRVARRLSRDHQLQTRRQGLTSRGDKIPVRAAREPKLSVAAT